MSDPCLELDRDRQPSSALPHFPWGQEHQGVGWQSRPHSDTTVLWGLHQLRVRPWAFHPQQGQDLVSGARVGRLESPWSFQEGLETNQLMTWPRASLEVPSTGAACAGLADPALAREEQLLHAHGDVAHHPPTPNRWAWVDTAALGQ